MLISAVLRATALVAAATVPLVAQQPPSSGGAPATPARGGGNASAEAPIRIVSDSTITRRGQQVTIKGQTITYDVTVGTQPVWDGDNKPVASMFYTYYKRTGTGDIATRPLVISFNGGPGSASLWMHVAYTGPKILNIDSEGYPVQPYGVQDNPHSILDVADIVYIDPVNTGFSRILGEARREQFFGVNEDIA